MRIVTLGAGTVGTSIAELLCQHGHIVTVVDSDPAHVRRINAELDVRDHRICLTIERVVSGRCAGLGRLFGCNG